MKSCRRLGAALVCALVFTHDYSELHAQEVLTESLSNRVVEILAGDHTKYPDKPLSLAALGPEVLPILLGHLAEGESGKQIVCMLALGHLKDERGVDPLLAFLNEVRVHPRTESNVALELLAIQALGEIGGLMTVEYLVGILDEGNRHVIIPGLIQLGRTIAEVNLLALAQSEKTPLPDRLLACKGVSLLGDPRSIDAIDDFLLDKEQVFAKSRSFPPLREWAEALVALGTDEAMSVLMGDILTNRWLPSQASEMLKAVRELDGPPSEIVITGLLQVCGDDKFIESVRLDAAEILLQLSAEISLDNVQSRVLPILETMALETDWSPSVLNRVDESMSLANSAKFESAVGH